MLCSWSILVDMRWSIFCRCHWILFICRMFSPFRLFVFVGHYLFSFFLHFVVSIVNATYLNPVRSLRSFSSVEFNFNEVRGKRSDVLASCAKNKQASIRKERRHKKPKNLYSDAQEFMLSETIIQLVSFVACPCWLLIRNFAVLLCFFFVQESSHKLLGSGRTRRQLSLIPQPRNLIHNNLPGYVRTTADHHLLPECSAKPEPSSRDRAN